MKCFLRWSRVAAVFVVAVALIAGLIVRARNAMQPRIRLPDGSILRVAKVDYGEMHEFYRGSESLQKAGEFVTEHLPFYYALPSGIRHPFERMTSYVGSGFSRGGNSLAVWIWHQPGTSAPLDIKGAELLDDATGQCLDFSDFENRNSTVSPSHVSFSVLPRRQPTLTIRILAGDQSRLLTIENPFARRKFPEWHPAALPQSKRVAEIDMTMRGWDSFRDGTAANQLNFFALIDIRVEGGLRNDWFRSYPSTEDATGNSGSRLPLSESAWKVSVRTVRTADHPLVRARSDTLADIPIPLPGTVVEIPLTDALRKRGFVYAAVHGHGRFWFVDGQCLASGVMDEKVPEPVTAMRNWSYSSVFGPSLLLVAAPGSAAARSITWVIEDQDGQRLEDYYYQSNERSDDGYVICKQQFRPLPASRTFKAVIGDPGKEYSAEFIAPPPRWPR